MRVHSGQRVLINFNEGAFWTEGAHLMRGTGCFLAHLMGVYIVLSGQRVLI